VGVRAEQTRKHYEQWMYEDSLLSPTGAYFEGSGFANYGYWEPETKGPREACENLMEKLLSFIPRKQGMILDVACGMGATTRHLLNHFSPEEVTGVDVSEKNLDSARANAPGCIFRQMDATRLEFPGDTFDNVISVEAAFHFDTRDQFLREARRVLKPGGYLVLADVLYDRWAETASPLLHPANHVRDPQAYEDVLRRAGFDGVKVVDVTEESWIRSNAHATRHFCDNYKAGRIDRQRFNRMMLGRLLRIISAKYYVVAAGIKPARSQGEEARPSDPDGVEFSPGRPGPGSEPLNGQRTLIDNARWSRVERTMRLHQTARAEKALARLARQTGDERRAKWHEALARLYLRAALPRRRRR
jgi:ubiquinone/menaquinone biosynthesis C-methylase UbiE